MFLLRWCIPFSGATPRWDRHGSPPRRNEMDEMERARLLVIRLRSKRGRGVTDGEMEFCLAMLKKDPGGYDDVGREVLAEVRRDFAPGG